MDTPSVHYVTTADGYSIAYTVTGQGRTFLLAPLPYSHQLLGLGPDRPLTRGFAARYRLIGYDARGQGMSTRNLPSDLTVNDLILDMEAVVDKLSLDRVCSSVSATRSARWGSPTPPSIRRRLQA